MQLSRIADDMAGGVLNEAKLPKYLRLSNAILNRIDIFLANHEIGMGAQHSSVRGHRNNGFSTHVRPPEPVPFRISSGNFPALGVCAVEISIARKCHSEDSFSFF